MKYGKRKKATKEANYRKYSKYKKAPGGGGGGEYKKNHKCKRALTGFKREKD